MSETRCDKCNHWAAKSEEWEAENVGFRLCEAVRPRWEIADEASEALAKSIGKQPYDDDAPEEQFGAVRLNALRAARAYVQDGSQYTASLWTGPDFFCALFTASQST